MADRFLGICSTCGAALPSDGKYSDVCTACAFAQALGPAPPDPEPSPIVGPYRLIEKIGEGGMGEVWRAEQTEPVQRMVALKIVKLGMDTRQVLARFDAERQALALMDHPSESRVLDAGTTSEGRPYFVMEYVAGCPITEHCDRHRLTTAERLALFMQVCDGVQHAHQKAIIHRDLKPSNVLVALQDGVALPKIIDFGVAKATARKLTGTTLFTEVGVLIGTPEYMSPEQADPTAHDVDTRTDVYALGVMLYELLTGALPFESQALREAGLDGIRRMIREVEPPRPSIRLTTLGMERSIETARQRRVDLPTLRRELRGELDWITLKALEKDRARRYGSPAELAADLKRYLRNEPVLAGPVSAAYRARKFVRRHRVGVLAASVAALALAAFAVAMGVQTRRIAREIQSKRRVSEFLTEMFEVSDPSEARGNSITARELLDHGAARIRANLTDDPRVRAELMTTMGVVYRNLGLYPQAEPLLREALATRTRALGANDPETLRLASETVQLYLRQGRAKEAEALGRETLDKQERVLGPDHPDTLASLNSIAGAYQSLGRTSEAEALFRTTLETQRRVLGPDHPETLKTMTDLTTIYVAQGREKEATALIRESFDNAKRVLGPEHPDTLRSMRHLARAYAGRSQFREAEALLRDSLAIEKRVLGPAHAETLATLSGLADLYWIQDRFQEAEPLYRETFDLRRQVLGPEHRETLKSMCALANTYWIQGRAEEGEALAREALVIQKRVLGPQHPDTIYSMASLSVAFESARRYAEAEALYRETIDISRRALGPQHPYTLDSMSSLAGMYSKLGRYAEAEGLLRETIEAQRAHGPQHPDTLNSICRLARTLALQGKRAEALGCLRDAVERGYANAQALLDDPDLVSLRGNPEFATLMAAAKANQERVARGR